MGNKENTKREDALLEQVEESIAEEMEEEGIALELLREFKENNKRMDDHNKRLIGTLKVMAVTIAAIVAAFLIYLYQYDFQSYSQDGSGYNNINTGTQGDVNNGTEIPSPQAEGRQGEGSSH